MSFKVEPQKIKKGDINKKYSRVKAPLAIPPLAITMISRRRQGKSTLAVSMLINGGYISAFSEVLILSETIAHDKTYDALKKYDNVSVHDIRKRPINNELLSEIWDRQEERVAKDPKADLLIVFDDLASKLKSKDLRATINKYYQLCRHPKISIINLCQSILNLTSEMISCTTTFIIFSLDAKALTTVSEKLASSEMDRDQLQKYIKVNTKEKHSFVQINLEAESDDLVYLTYSPRSNAFSRGIRD